MEKTAKDISPIDLHTGDISTNENHSAEGSDSTNETRSDEGSDSTNETRSTEGSDSIKNKPSGSKRFFKVVRRILIWILSTLLVLLLGAYVFLYYTNKGPSPHLTALFVSSAMESSAGGYLVRLFYSKEEIEQIRNQNLMKEMNEVTDTTLIHVMAAETLSQNDSEKNSSDGSVSDNAVHPEDPDGDGIIVYDVHGPPIAEK
ncbi:MAG: hypothetical protein ACI4DU_03040 [Lachnospiraceae bacterium]